MNNQCRMVKTVLEEIRAGGDSQACQLGRAWEKASRSSIGHCQACGEGRVGGVQNQTNRVQNQILPLTSHMTLGKFIKISRINFLIYKMIIFIIVFISGDYYVY